MSETISASALAISIISLWWAKKAQDKAKIGPLFSEFQRANQVTIDHPNILNAVHGLDLQEDECRRIAYLSILMDAFQQEKANHTATTFLDKRTSVPKNKTRWGLIKKIYYGSFDREFIEKIDAKFETNINPKASACYENSG